MFCLCGGLLAVLLPVFPYKPPPPCLLVKAAFSKRSVFVFSMEPALASLPFFLPLVLAIFPVGPASVKRVLPGGGLRARRADPSQLQRLVPPRDAGRLRAPCR